MKHPTAAEEDRAARGMVLFCGQEITREAYDRIRGATPADELTRELADGQTVLRADVEEPTGQLALEELAPAPKPAPVSFERDATELAAREELEELAGGPRLTVESPYGARTVDGLEHGDEVPPPIPPRDDLEEADRDAAVLELEEELVHEERAERRARRTGAELRAKLAVPKPRGAPHTCAACGAELEPDHWIFSRHTRARYCYPGEGCNVPTQHRAGRADVELTLEELRHHQEG